ncbi:MAG: FlgD immunoglobulin-like domain containing protein [Fidelibacterota bacterium]
MILSAARPDQGELLVDMGSLGKKGSREIVFNTEHFTRENSKVMVTYIMFSEDQEVAGQGTRIMELKAIPEEFSLHQNYPNPFNPYTTILYDLPQNSKVSLVVYDILGREVATLVNGKKPAGYYSLRWDGRDDSGRPLASGLYIYRISARGSNGGTYSKVRKMILLK